MMSVICFKHIYKRSGRDLNFSNKREVDKKGLYNDSYTFLYLRSNLKISLPPTFSDFSL